VRAINKGQEPTSLTRHRLTPNGDYDNFEEKADLRLALVTEQRGLCCYCMGRIHYGPTTMKIEHWRCRAQYPGEQLNYHNLLGACLGGHGQPRHKQHCDTKKSDSSIKWNPADPADRIETRIRYELDGSIRSDDATFNTQLDSVLNLNLNELKNSRKGVYSGFLEWWAREKNRIQGPVSRARLERERDRLVGGDGKLDAYIPVAVWLLEQRLAKHRRRSGR
jgi:uncharacterized protein (TIGR02646 family)